MENTGRVLFDDETPQWYVAQGEGWLGPLPAGDVYGKILAQEITWLDFVWRQGQEGWKRLADVETFQSVAPRAPKAKIPAAPAAASKHEVRQAPSRATMPPPSREWFLYYNESQFGPFSFDEVTRALTTGKIHGRVYAWKDGMDTWAKLEQVEPFAEAVAESAEAWAKRRAEKQGAAAAKVPGAPAAAQSTGAAQPFTQAQADDSRVDQRKAPRRPLVARITLAAHDTVTVALCRDISVGGMQVLTDRIPGQVGTRIKLNASPSAAAYKDPAGGRIEPFVAEGVIVRILEDHRGFSFRFEKLSDQAKRAIESYIALV